LIVSRETPAVSDFAMLMPSRLAAERAPVLVGRPDEGPVESGTSQARAQVPARLQQAGGPFALMSGDGNERPRLSLLQLAAGAVSAGLPADAALAAVTIQPARILGIADRQVDSTASEAAPSSRPGSGPVIGFNHAQSSSES